MAQVRRFDHVGITVADLNAVTAFFVGLGLEVEGRMFVEGDFLDTVIGIPDSRTEIVMLRPPDGSTRLELSSFVRPEHQPGSPAAMANELGLRNVAFEVDDLQAAVEQLAANGYGLVGDVGEYEHFWRMAYVRGPEGIIVSLAERIDRPAPTADPAGNHPKEENNLTNGPTRFEVHQSGALLHGTKAHLAVGDLLVAGHLSNYEPTRVMNHVYVTETLDAAAWGAELAVGDGPGRIYRVEPTGDLEDDPNVTNKKFPGNPTRSYRTREPVRIVGELTDWRGHTSEQVQAMKDGLADLARRGIAVIYD